MSKLLGFIVLIGVLSCKQSNVSSSGSPVGKIEENGEIRFDGDALVINRSSFMGVNCNDRIRILKTNSKLFIVKDTIQNGEGDFEVYNLNNEEGVLMALLFPNYDEDEKVHQIVVISPKAKTPEGISPGQTFGELRQIYKNVKVSGSEIEGWTHAETDDFYFKLDTFAFEPNLDVAKIGKKLPILEIRGKCE